MKKATLLIICFSFLAIPSNRGVADEIGFIERFALAVDREAVLKELVPGTEDYYYFHCLHYQNTEKFGKVDELTKKWISRFGTTARAREILNRQALLTYESNPAKSIAYLKSQLNLNLNHQRENLQGASLASILDAKLISRETLTRRALSRYGNTQGFETRALDWLIDQKLDMNDLRHLLQRLTIPDHPKLVDLVLLELQERHSPGFGAMAIHRNMTRKQLDELEKKYPRILNQTNFVNIVLSKIRPDSDVDFKNSADAKQRHLDQLWAFVKRLAPVHNSLKANVLYHQLVLDRSQGKYDRQRFVEYIQLPRNAVYVNPDYLKDRDRRQNLCNLSANYSGQTMLPPIGNDVRLVNDFLQHFFKTDQDHKAFETYLNDRYVRRQFAESKIIHGLGDPEKWASMISPSEYQAIKDRVDLSFTYTNRSQFGVEQPVSVKVRVKNVSNLIVKVFEINTQNFYRDRQSEIDTGIELDGLLPNFETVHQFTESPFIQKERKFDFPELKSRGIYVIDFIGNRNSCRALIRKGQLKFVESITAAGHELKVLDENNKVVNGANVWMQGKQYASNPSGEILIPFSNRPGMVPIVLSDGKTSFLDHLNHRGESYQLNGGIFIDRESLLAGRMAHVVVRSELRINGVSAPVKLLENVRLTLTSTDLDGTVSTKEVKDFKLHAHQESVFEFTVPDRMQAIQATVNAEIKNLARGKTDTLSMSEVFYVNAIEKETKIEDLFLVRSKSGYAVDLLGKNGELKVGRPVVLKIKHADFKNTVDLSLQTNMRGRVELGELKDIAWIKATGPEGVSQTWWLLKNRNSHHSIHVKKGDVVQVPINRFGKNLSRHDLAFFKKVDNTYLSNEIESVEIENGILSIPGLSAGTYQLVLKSASTQISIYVIDGDLIGEQIVGKRRNSVIQNPRPVQVASIVRKEKSTVIQLSGAVDGTRVHLIATRYQPRFDVFSKLSGMVWNRVPGTLPSSMSVYVDGRRIGDEYQYILDRKYAEKYPGVMLKRPGLLLQPWAVRATQTSRQNAAAGNKFDAKKDSQSRSGNGPAASASRGQGNSDSSTMDFLGDGSAVFLNLVAKDGKIEIDNEDFNGNHLLQVMAISPGSTAYRVAAFEENDIRLAERVFANGLDPSKRFARKKEISFVDAGKEFVVTDVATGRIEVYDNLPSVYRLFSSLNPDPKLTEFAFILEWNDKKLEEKLKLYSKYSCHELNFFLSRKDPGFFEAVVLPYIRNKKEKTFLDHLLLRNDLSNYLNSWEYSQLNVVERILLASRIAEEKENTLRHVSDHYEINPTSRDQFDRLFKFALRNTVLDEKGDDDLKTALGDLSNASRAIALNGLVDKKVMQQGQGRSKSVPLPAVESKKVDGRGIYGRDAIGMNRQAMTLENSAPTSPKRAADRQSRGRRYDIPQQAAGAYFYKETEKLGKAIKGRAAVKQLFRQIEKTKEWAENNYYHLTIDKQNAGLVSVNQFWRDFAAHDSREPFFSANVAEAAGNFTEMMFAISVLDLEWESQKHDYKKEKQQLRLTAKSPLFIFHEQIRPAVDGRKGTSILVSQNFFKVGDRYRYEGPDRLDKFVTEEFIRQTAYGCQVVVTNPTSAKQKIDLLLQVPVGSMPLAGHLETRSIHLELEPYRTSAIEYFFYFPESGRYSHYPVNVAKREEVIAFAEPTTFNVVDAPSKVDKSSWAFISQNGTEAQVLEYLESNNLVRTDLKKIAWRMKEAGFYRKTVDLLKKYHVYQPDLWAYGFQHQLLDRMKDYLAHRNDFISKTGPYIESRLLVNDRVARKTYEHLEYEPLVNARAHQLGAKREILNNRFFSQYHRLLWILSCKAEFTNEDLLSLSYYMLLQDRVNEAVAYFKKASAGTLQYDYMAAYLDMLNLQPTVARGIASKYKDYKVLRWRNAFRAILEQLDEIEGKSTNLVDSDNRNQVQDDLASRSPTFDFNVDSRKIEITYANLEQVQVNFYVMDVELLFSRNPFVQRFSGELTYIRPRKTSWVKLAKNKSKHELTLPKELNRSNVLIEVSGGDLTKTQAYYANALTVQTVESYGQIRVMDQKSGKKLPKTYCKVYAQMKDGSVKFYKDGYTDLRGRFDYTSLSTNDLDNVNRFSILVMSDDNGAMVREVLPPKR